MEFIPAGNLPVPLSAAVKAGDWIYVSGMVANEPDASVFIGDFDQEVSKTFDRLEEVLQQLDATLNDAVKINAYLANPMHFARFNELYAERLGDHRPARTTVAVTFGHPDVRVEMDLVAYVGD
ncbi:RidA family protein [Propionibacteriaceae bacterium Y1685]|uniref:RidA family protein n=1 Tax=Microlunatus sp. Y1700 TaxID=3418487 RepID=UPI003B778614